MNARRRNDYESFSISGWLAGRWARAVEAFRSATGQDGFEQSSMGGGIGSWLGLPFRVAWAFFGFLLSNWSTSRSGTAFLWSLPALLAAGGFIGLIALANTVPFRVLGVALPDPEAITLGRSMKLQEWAGEKSNLEERDALLRDSLLAARHLVDLRPNKPAYKFRLALLENQLDNRAECRNLMRQIAPLESRGEVSAHVWQAVDLLYGEHPEMSDADRRDQAFIHLRHAEGATAEEMGEDGFRARLVLAEMLRQDGQREAAMSLLREIIKGKLANTYQLDSIILLAQLHREAGEFQEQKIYTDTAIEKLFELTLSMPNTPAIWVYMSRLCEINDDYKRASQVLMDGMTAASIPEVKQILLAEQVQLFLRQGRQIANPDSREGFLKHLSVMGQAILTNPMALELYDQLLPCVDIHRERADEEEAWMRDALLDPDMPSVVIQIMLSLRDMQKGNFAAGSSELLSCFRRLSMTPLLVNKFLIVLAERTSGHEENLVNVASVAIESFPGQYYLCFPRAMLYRKLGQHALAATDLRLVAEKMPESPEPVEMLALVLAESGDDTGAAAARSQAEALREKERERQTPRRGSGSRGG